MSRDPLRNLRHIRRRQADLRLAETAEIERLLAAGVDARVIGAALGVSRSGVYKLLARRGTSATAATANGGESDAGVEKRT